MALLGLESLLMAGRSDIKEALLKRGHLSPMSLPTPALFWGPRHWLLPTGPPSAAGAVAGAGAGAGPVAGAVAGAGAGAGAVAALSAAGATGDSAPASSCDPRPCSSVTAITDTGDGFRCWRLEVVPLFWRNGARKPITPMYLHTCCFSLAPAPLLWASFSFTLSLRYRSLRDLHLFIHSGTLQAARYLAVLIDGDTDISNTECEIVYVRFVEDGRPVTRLVGQQALLHAHAQSFLAGTNAVFNALDMVYATGRPSVSHLVQMALQSTWVCIGE
ncbi:unnamed protein product [Gadus morhua 'NCC']